MSTQREIRDTGFSRLGLFFRRRWSWMALGILLATLTVLANVTLMSLSGWFITAMAVAGVGGTAINYFTPAAIIRGLAMIRTAGRYGERVVTHEATFRLIEELRVWLFSRIEPLVPRAVADLHSAELLNRLQKDVDRLDGVYLRLVLPVAVAALSTVVYGLFVGLYSLNLMALLMVLWLLGGVAIPLWIRAMTGNAASAQLGLLASMRIRFLDALEGVGDLINSGAARRQLQAQQVDGHELEIAQDRLHRWSSLGQTSIMVLSGMAVWLSLLLIIPLHRSGDLTGPQLTMLALFALAGFEAISPLPAALALWGETRAALGRIVDLADRQEAQEQGARADVPEDMSIEFDDVSLSYEPGKIALADINLRLEPGSRTLLVGPSGAGKSSLVNLMLRFWEPDSGVMRVNGMVAREFDSEAWRSRIAVVSQKPTLFAASIRENLLLARPNADDDQIRAVCEAAGLWAFIEEQPDGLDTWVGETGVKLSGGQGRRLAIARGLLKESSVLILDEPTEGLDSGTAKTVMAGIIAALNGRTLLVISHQALPGLVFDQTLKMDRGVFASN